VPSGFLLILNEVFPVAFGVDSAVTGLLVTIAAAGNHVRLS